MSMNELYHDLHVRLRKTSIRKLQYIKSTKGYKTYADVIRNLIDEDYSNIIKDQKKKK